MIDTLLDPSSRDREMLVIMLVSNVISLLLGVVVVMIGFGFRYCRDEIEIRREIRARHK